MERTVIWGIDPGVDRIACAIRWPQDSSTELVSFDVPTARDWQQKLALIALALARLAPAWIENNGFPAIIAIERPAAHGRPNVHLIQAYGVIQAQLQLTLFHYGGRTGWLEAGASEWKKGALGDGSADTLEYCRRLRELGVAFQNADEAAAYWIATWAHAKIAP